MKKKNSPICLRCKAEVIKINKEGLCELCEKFEEENNIADAQGQL